LPSGGTWSLKIVASKDGHPIATKQLEVSASGSMGCEEGSMIERTVDWCNSNRFLLFFGVLALILAGVWSLKRIPLDALPDISDVQVIIHTQRMGQPPNLIEDQATYPIVTVMLAAPHVKAVRAQTMPNDSYVFVVFEDGTDVYWARSQVLEYLQQITGKLPAGVNPAIGPDATGAGWVYEYALVDKSRTHSLADLRSLQDWNVRYALETVPGVSEIATIGGFVKQCCRFWKKCHCGNKETAHFETGQAEKLKEE
jgi:Cu(I)/Ag(I) efflux system membrane protein CusA/SilA